MAIPEAIVTVELTQIEAIPAGFVPAAPSQVYAMTSIGTRELGRTSLIPTGASTFALGRKLDVPVYGAALIKVTVNIWEDRGDAAPNQLGSYQKDIVSPWTSGPILFGPGPKVKGKITTASVLPGGGRVAAPRGAVGGPPVGAVVSPRRSFTVEFTEIQGLYEPGYAPPPPLGRPLRRAEYHAGYTSADHRGRIYVNRDLSGNWAKDTQLIQITARVHVSSGTLPPGSKIRWIIFDPDDPFDDDPHIHRQWAPYLDANDYPGGTPSGAKGGDNEGTPDKSPRWEAVAGSSLMVVSPIEALTTVAGNQSKVKIHCPNTPGDNLIVRAEIRPVPAAALGRAFPAETGIMTMWSRIDVEYIKMASALDLPVADVPPMLEPACIQLDFQPPTPVPDQLNMEIVAGDLEGDSFTYTTTNCKHAGKEPGWFCLVAAMMPYPVAIIPDPPPCNVDLGSEWVGPIYREFAIVPGLFPDAAVIEFSWGGNVVTFEIYDRKVLPGPPIRTKCFLDPHDIQDQFTAGDGSTQHAYAVRLFFLPNAKIDGATVTPGGYSMPTPVQAVVKSKAGLYTAGISPRRLVARKLYFMGRTLVFTHHHRAYRDRVTGLPLPGFHDLAVSTIAHEFSHAFGMPHRCGFFDLRTPRDKTCTMNYRVHWMIDPVARTLIPGTSEKKASISVAGTPKSFAELTSRTTEDWGGDAARFHSGGFRLRGRNHLQQRAIQSGKGGDEDVSRRAIGARTCAVGGPGRADLRPRLPGPCRGDGEAGCRRGRALHQSAVRG
jgi:hypothetical protein